MVSSLALVFGFGVSFTLPGATYRRSNLYGLNLCSLTNSIGLLFLYARLLVNFGRRSISCKRASSHLVLWSKVSDVGIHESLCGLFYNRAGKSYRVRTPLHAFRLGGRLCLPAGQPFALRENEYIGILPSLSDIHKYMQQ